MFAQPGVSWLELCQRGVQNRVAPSIDRVYLLYLRAWCHVASRDLDLAIDALGELRRAKTSGIPQAVRFDIVNILADAGSADDAERMLARASIDDLAVYDLLAATYAEVSKLDDAREINERALAGGGSHEVRCRRLLRRILLAGATPPMASIGELGSRGMADDPTCVRFDHAVSCQLHPGRDCTPYFADAGIDPRNALLLSAYVAWPPGPAPSHRWWSITVDALDALGIPHADLLAATALEVAARTSVCPSGEQERFRAAALEILAERTHDPQLDPMLFRVRDHALELCLN